MHNLCPIDITGHPLATPRPHPLRHARLHANNYNNKKETRHTHTYPHTKYGCGRTLVHIFAMISPGSSYGGSAPELDIVVPPYFHRKKHTHTKQWSVVYRATSHTHTHTGEMMKKKLRNPAEARALSTCYTSPWIEATPTGGN